MGGWNSAEYQRSNNNRDEDQGRSAGQGMATKGETMRESWTIKLVKTTSSLRLVDVDKLHFNDSGPWLVFSNIESAKAALWACRARAKQSVHIKDTYKIMRCVVRNDAERRALADLRFQNQANRIANALINYVVDNSASDRGYRFISTDVVLGFAQEIKDGKR